jgi:hypothetical protein
VTVFAVWTRLIRPDLPVESRIRGLWLAFAGVAILMSSTTVYFLSEVGAGFNDIGQGAFGLWFKFLGENIPFIVLPPLVLYAIHLQIDAGTRSAPMGGQFIAPLRNVSTGPTATSVTAAAASA